jgi:hypothetical protein
MNCVCGGCGKVINSNFYYCPWCGYSRLKNDTQASIELEYKRYKSLKNENQRQAIAKMEQQLDELERELSVLVLSTEMAK